MSRRAARKHAFFLLYQKEFHADFDPFVQTGLYFENALSPAGEDGELSRDISESDKEFILREVFGTVDKLCEIDALIKKNLSGWEIDRIGKIDLTVIRLAVFEMLYNGIPHGVSINEAVEIAKIYGNEDSYQFVNGILGRILKLAGDKADGKSDIHGQSTEPLHKVGI